MDKQYRQSTLANTELSKEYVFQSLPQNKPKPERQRGPAALPCFSNPPDGACDKGPDSGGLDKLSCLPSNKISREPEGLEDRFVQPEQKKES